MGKVISEGGYLILLFSYFNSFFLYQKEPSVGSGEAGFSARFGFDGILLDPKEQVRLKYLNSLSNVYQEYSV